MGSVVDVTWSLLAPATAVVITLCVLAWSMHRVELELAALRASLRRSRAAGVAIDELRRETAVTMHEVERLEQQSRRRADLRRRRRRPTDR